MVSVGRGMRFGVVLGIGRWSFLGIAVGVGVLVAVGVGVETCGKNPAETVVLSPVSAINTVVPVAGSASLSIKSIWFPTASCNVKVYPAGTVKLTL